MSRHIQLAVAAIALLGVAACASPTAQDASASAPACINPTRIEKQEILSDREIRFEMNDGTVWINTLKRECNGLKFEGGFAWDVRGTQVCSDQQIITVLNAGNTCMLGTFAKAPAAPT
jgi:hypothetical protein